MTVDIDKMGWKLNKALPMDVELGVNDQYMQDMMFLDATASSGHVQASSCCFYTSTTVLIKPARHKVYNVKEK